MEKKHIFWDTQPVARNSNDSLGLVNDKFIKKSKPIETVIPESLNWCNFDIHDPKEFDEFHQFLVKNYRTENEDFPLQYTPELIKWSLDLNLKDYKVKNLDSLKYLHIGLRTDSGVLVGVITAVPVYLLIQGKSIHTAIVNHLCVIKELREKGLAAYLIKELIRITRLENPNLLKAPLFNAVNLPFSPIVSVNVYVRYLNIEKLTQTNFINPIDSNIDYNNFGINKPLNLTYATITDLKECYKIFKNNQYKYKLCLDFKNFKQFSTYYKNNNNKGPIYTLVLKKNNKVTDWISFYKLPCLAKDSKILLNAVSLLRIEVTTISETDLLNNAFLFAKNMGFDYFNLLDTYDLGDSYHELKLDTFNDGMTYYTFNYNCGEVKPNQVGIILP